MDHKGLKPDNTYGKNIRKVREQSKDAAGIVDKKESYAIYGGITHESYNIIHCCIWNELV